MATVEAAHFELTAHDPHSALGLQEHPDGKILRLWRPGARECYVEVCGSIRRMEAVEPLGFFELDLPVSVSAQDYRVYMSDGRLLHDPYSFPMTLGDLDLHLFSKGVHYELHRILGANPIEIDGIKGVRFAVWAPNAHRVALVGDFNHWNGRVHPMRSCGGSGLWELFVPGIQPGEKYKFEVCDQCGKVSLRADPVAFSAELRPSTASVVAELNFSWQDAAWVSERAKRGLNIPMSIYEVHLGSWRQQSSQFMNYRELAVQLAEYCRDMGYTHVELMPVMEHPLDESWGYQVTGFFSVTSRHGTPNDFQFFVNYLHLHGIGVLLDWVPGHFPVDNFALAHFDGTALYEHSDTRQSLHPHWNTLIFNYARKEVSNFLIASALYWLEVMHVDGLRVDAVASMLYLDYGREEGEWIPNKYGGNTNLDAVEFLKHLNAVVHERVPGALTIAEESTAFPGVTSAVKENGLGFDLKWNMGWMNDTLEYFKTDALFRCYHHSQLTFGLLYAFSERFVLPFSHDEVVHGKGSLLSKMPGDAWQKMANMRLLYSYQVCQPGKKLLFMTADVGQWSEWNCKSEMEWHLLRFPVHDGIKASIRSLNRLYQATPALWQRDFDSAGFEWVGLDDVQNSVVSYIRRGESSAVFCIHNFTPTCHSNYFLAWEEAPLGRLIFNSDAPEFGGAGFPAGDFQFSKGGEGKIAGVRLSLPPLATLIYVLESR